MSLFWIGWILSAFIATYILTNKVMDIHLWDGLYNWYQIGFIYFITLLYCLTLGLGYASLIVAFGEWIGKELE